MSSLIDVAALLWLVLLLLGTVFLFRRSRMAGVTLLGLAGAWWLIEVTSLPGRLLAALEEPYLDSTQPSPQTADAIIVLGGWGKASTNEFAGLDFGPAADRVLKGFDLARRGTAPVFVVGGAAAVGGNSHAEPALIRLWVEEWGLLELPVHELPPCRTTRDEAMRVMELAKEQGWNRVLLVTSAWHMKRAEATFRAVGWEVGLEVVPVGCDFLGTASLRKSLNVVPQSQTLSLLQLWLHEVVGYQYYRVRGWAQP
jgi:uncharacterized SAM-binding protein YcdF (DUF218 family)